jgi:23S rRNA (uracil1939-C5)-methyltransferase
MSFELLVSASAGEQVAPPCPHFGPCGGCQYQMLAYEAQLRLKREALRKTLHDAGVTALPELSAHAGEPYGYRNRIRLRLLRTGGLLRFGYNAAAGDPLAIDLCLIAAPALWTVAQGILAAAAADRDAAFWLDAASEVELFCNHDQTQVQVTLLCAPRTKAIGGSLERALAAFRAHTPAGIELAGAGAVASDLRTGPTGRVLAAAGSAGLAYRVLDETYWITRGGFFQVNRFLAGTLVQLAATGRSGQLAWDLFAGVGLFSRVLARSFAQVIAVEANAAASADNRAALAKIGAAHRAVESTALDFLRGAVLQRERPELVVLDPPRAGAGVEACELLARLGPRTIVYVSCDPATLARDLGVLQKHYRISGLAMVDLFPQTAHVETVAVLDRL